MLDREFSRLITKPRGAPGKSPQTVLDLSGLAGLRVTAAPRGDDDFPAPPAGPAGPRGNNDRAQGTRRIFLQAEALEE